MVPSESCGWLLLGDHDAADLRAIFRVALNLWRDQNETSLEVQSDQVFCRHFQVRCCGKAMFRGLEVLRTRMQHCMLLEQEADDELDSE